MQILERIRARAASDLQHIVLTEGEDERTIRAASMCATERLAQITLIGSPNAIRDKAQQIGVSLTGVSLLDHLHSPEVDRYAARYQEVRRAKGVTADEARHQMADRCTSGI